MLFSASQGKAFFMGKTESVALYWLRNDLRLHDNEALQLAAKANSMLMLYCIDPRQFEMLDIGFRKTGLLRFRFLIESLTDLQTSCRKRNNDLLVIVGKPEEVINKLIPKYNITQLIYQQEVTSEELAVEAAVNNVAASHNCEVQTVWGLTLYHVQDAPFPPEKTPDKSKEFRLTLTKNADVRSCIPIPEKFPPLPKNFEPIDKLPEPAEVGFNQNEIEDEGKGMVTGGETAGLQRLQHYTFETEQLTGYRWSRNRSLGMDYSSKFSPWMALGCLSPRYIYWHVKNYEEAVKKNASTWWLVFEIVWRDFFKYVSIKHGNKVFFESGVHNRKVDWSHDKELFEKWRSGNTGIPFVDAHIRELNQTGFMSNRGRVNCASFLTRDYKIDWRWGAAWFENTLLDHDVSSNWLNWNTQATEIWYTNPVHQGVKYDKKGDYVRTWLPELKDLPDFIVQAPWLMGGEKLAEINYPQPVEVYKKWQRSVNGIIKAASLDENTEAV